MQYPRLIGQTGKYMLRPSKIKDADTVLKDIRREDLEEWYASVEGGVEGNLKESINVSMECWTICDADDNAHIIWGVVDVGPDKTNVTWLLGTNEGQRIAPWAFYECLVEKEGFFHRWPTTECWSDSRNIQHHVWLEWVGYKLVEVTPGGVDGDTSFHHYRKEPA